MLVRQEEIPDSNLFESINDDEVSIARLEPNNRQIVTKRHQLDKYKVYYPRYL